MQHINVEPLMTIQQLSITHVAQADSVRVTPSYAPCRGPEGRFVAGDFRLTAA